MQKSTRIAEISTKIRGLHFIGPLCRGPTNSSASWVKI